jgi:hypothetical protein
MDVREQITDAAEIQQQHKELRPKTAATYGKQGDILWGPRTNHQAGDREARHWIFCED